MRPVPGRDLLLDGPLLSRGLRPGSLLIGGLGSARLLVCRVLVCGVLVCGVLVCGVLVCGVLVCGAVLSQFRAGCPLAGGLVIAG